MRLWPDLGALLGALSRVWWVLARPSGRGVSSDCGFPESAPPKSHGCRAACACRVVLGKTLCVYIFSGNGDALDSDEVLGLEGSPALGYMSGVIVPYHNHDSSHK